MLLKQYSEGATKPAENSRVQLSLLRSTTRQWTRRQEMETLFHSAAPPIMWHFTLVTDGHKVAAGVWNICRVQLASVYTACGSAKRMCCVVIFFFLINVPFCLCETVRIRLVFHSKHGLYTYTNTLEDTHRQLGAHSHTPRRQRRTHTHTDTHGHSGIDSVCEANSFCHKWSQIGSGQSPITPHLVWP